MVLKLSIQHFNLRRAIVEDADWAVSLLFSAGPALFSYIFASPFEQAQEILYQAFVLPEHAFSYEHALVIEINQQAAGLMIGYPGDLKRRVDEKVHLAMTRLIPLRKLPKILVNVADFSRIKQDVASNDYYILGIGVLPEFHHCEVESYLLEYAEKQAYTSNCQTVCTDVTYTNERVKSLLEHHGYRAMCSKTTHRFDQMTRSGGIHRMVKFLT